MSAAAVAEPYRQSACYQIHTTCVSGPSLQCLVIIISIIVIIVTIGIVTVHVLFIAIEFITSMQFLCQLLGYAIVAMMALCSSHLCHPDNVITISVITSIILIIIPLIILIIITINKQSLVALASASF